jgi:hypothetical protein
MKPEGAPSNSNTIRDGTQFCGWTHWRFSLRLAFLAASACSDHMQHIRQHNDLSMKEAGAFKGSVAARRLVCYSFVP